MTSKRFSTILIIALTMLFSMFTNVSAKKIQEVEGHIRDFSAHPHNSLYQPLIEKYVRMGLPGLVMLVRTPEDGLWIGAAGMSRIEDKIPMHTQSLFHAVCATKPYTAACIMMLKDAGRIDLDNTIDNYLPSNICDNIANGRTATVRQLLNKTAGMPCINRDGINMEKWFDPFGEHNWQKEIKRIYGKSAKFEPGTEYYYADTNFLLLALIIDRVTGGNHADFFTQRIIQSLSLHQTYYKNEPGYPVPFGLVNSYFDRYGDGMIENISDVYNSIRGAKIGYSGLIISVYDLACFFEALFGEKLISSESQEEMKEGSLPNDSFGLSVSIANTPYGEAYGYVAKASAAMTTVFHFPDLEITIVYCSNIGTFNESPNAMVYTAIWQDIKEAVFERRNDPDYLSYRDNRAVDKVVVQRNN